MRHLVLADYWMGRDAAYPEELTDGIRANAQRLLKQINALLAVAGEENIYPGIDQHTGTWFSSGWRPRVINERTSNAGKRSTHIMGLAGDLQDTSPDRPLARWCLAHAGNGGLLEQLGLYMERPQWTGGADPWVHLQIVPPGSGRRVYIPSSAPALAAALPEETAVA